MLGKQVKVTGWSRHTPFHRQENPQTSRNVYVSPDRLLLSCGFSKHDVDGPLQRNGKYCVSEHRRVDVRFCMRHDCCVTVVWHVSSTTC